MVDRLGHNWVGVRQVDEGKYLYHVGFVLQGMIGQYYIHIPKNVIKLLWLIQPQVSDLLM